MSFAAPRWLENRHLQTIAGALRLPARLSPRRERWELPDGDFLDVDHHDAADPDAPLVILCHGLEASSRAAYVLGAAAELALRGLAVCALNFRGCSGEDNRRPRFYHSGETGDLGYAVDRLIAARPGRRLGLAGFSLGGNVVAKYLGERGGDLPSAVRAGAVVSVPFDLARCAYALDGPTLTARLYRERFLRTLRAKAAAKARRFPSAFDARTARRARTIEEFDQAVTAPVHGFVGAEEYYRLSSSGPFVPALSRPTLVVQAEDDPFIPRDAVPTEALRHNPLVTLVLSEQGGHVGFVDGWPWSRQYFAERRIAEFLAARLA